MKKKQYQFLIMALGLMLAACDPSSPNRITRDRGQLPPGEGIGSIPTSICDAPGTGDQAIDYYRIPVVLNGPPLPGGYQGVYTWNSESELSDPTIFSTDVKLKARIKVKPAPTANLYSYCNFTSPYEILSVTVSVYGEGDESATESFTFSNIKTNSCSRVHSFTVPTTPNYPILTISDGYSNFTCKWQGGFNCVQADQPHPAGGCYEVELHVETDFTKSIPQ